MLRSHSAPLWLGLISTSLVFAAACGDDEDDTSTTATTTTTTSSAGGGTTTSTTTGNGGAGGTTSSTGGGGVGGGGGGLTNEASIGQIGLSADGTTIAFSADAPTVGLYQVYTAAIGATLSPAVVSNVSSAKPPAGDQRGPSFFNPIIFSPNGNNILVNADWDLGGNDLDNDFTLFVLPASGAPGGVRLTPSPAMNQEVGAFGWSADGSRIYFVGDLVTDNQDALFSTDNFTMADQAAAGLLVRAPDESNGDIEDVYIPPMNAAADAYFYGDFVVNSEHSVGNVAGATPATLAPSGLAAAEDVRSVAVTPNGNSLVIAAEDSSQAVVLQVYGADGSGTPVDLVNPGDFANGNNAEIDSIQISPDGTLVAFRADLAVNGANELYVVPIDGSAVATRVSQAMATNDNDVGSAYTWTSDSASLVYTADPNTEDVVSLYITTVVSPTPTALVPEAMVTANAKVQDGPLIASDGKIYFKGDYEVDDLFRLYRVNTDGTSLEQVPGSVLFNDGMP